MAQRSADINIAECVHFSWTLSAYIQTQHFFYSLVVLNIESLQCLAGGSSCKTISLLHFCMIAEDTWHTD